MAVEAEIDVCPPVERSMHLLSHVAAKLKVLTEGLVKRQAATSVTGHYQVMRPLYKTLFINGGCGTLNRRILHVSYSFEPSSWPAYDSQCKVLEQSGQQFIVDRNGTKDAFTIHRINITYAVSLLPMPFMSFITEPRSKLLLYPPEHNPLLVRQLLLDAILDLRGGVGIGAGLLRTAVSYLHPPPESTPLENSED
ncbi:hypothetical protein TSMEX_004558 [Taenia solium]|eukprot:TsM_000738800 transcript=TsM_000738800 gene=TsM_000738800